MAQKIFVSFIILICFLLKTMAHGLDSMRVTNTNSVFTQDTIFKLDDETLKSQTQIFKQNKVFKPNPTRAVIYSAIFPGLGQIYNKKYWKLPLVYGGFLGLSYAISWNGKYYNDYTAGYKALMSSDPRSAENIAVWGPFIKGGKDPASLSDSELVTLTNSFKRNRDSYRRYRDLSIIGAVALYALCIIDAYVDAHMFDFDISPDLSMRVEPVSFNNVGDSNRFSDKLLGVQCSINF